MPSLWLIIPSFHPLVGGQETQVKDLAKAFIATGWSVDVLTRRNSQARFDKLSGRDVVEGIPVTRVYSRGVGKLGALLYMFGCLWRLIRHGRGAIYHAHDIGAEGWLAVIASRLLRGRSLIQMRTGVRGYEERLSSWLARWQFPKLLRLADRVVVVNTEVERLLIELGVPKRQIVLIPHGVDTSYYRPPSTEERLASREGLELPADKTLVLFVGRLVPIKGLDVLLRAWALLPTNVRTGATLLLVGDGEEREMLLSMVESLGLEESVVLVGEKQAVRDFYWAADLFVLPSRSEGMSLALNEAMACGLPVIASRVGGAPDVVEEGRNGVLFNSEDHDELTRKLTAMHELKYKWPEMGAHARATITEYADLDAVVKRLNALYVELN